MMIVVVVALATGRKELHHHHFHFHQGNMAPFSSVMITPEVRDMNFDKIIVKANNGKMESVKYR